MKTNWPTKKLGEVAHIYSGGTPRRSNPIYWNNDIPWLTMEDVNNGFEVVGTAQYISNQGLQNSNAQLVPAGSVNLSCTASVGNVTINRIPLATNQQFNSFHPRGDVDLLPEYLAYRLVFDRVKIKALGGSTTFQFISKGVISDLEIPLPSLNVQKKIVERLDTIRKAQEICDQQIQKTEELFESILDQELSKLGKVIIQPLSEFCEKITDGIHNTPPLANSGVPMLDSVDIQDMQINSNNPKKFISKETDLELSRRCKPKKDDVLISSRGTIGKIAIVGDQDFNIMGNIILIRPKSNELNPVYIANYLIVNREQILRLSRVTSQNGLYLTDVRNLEVKIPSFDEQLKIVEKLEAVQEYKKLLLKQKELLKELFDSVLDKSMKGELDN